MSVLFTPATIALQTIVFLSILVAIATIVLGIMNPNMSPKWCLASGMMTYIISFLTGFSIGRYVLTLTFILLSLAITHSMIRRNHLFSLIAVVVGFALWLIITSFIRFGWLFLPVELIFRLFGFY